MTGSGQCGENITWNLDANGKLTITGTGDFYDENSENHLPWRYLRYYIVDVNISDGIVCVPDYAFQNCDYLESVTLGKDIKSIGKEAFRECVRLTGIDLNAIESIKETAFANCTALKTVDLRHVSEINPGAFSGCQSLENIEFSNTIETIGEYAFARTGITSLVIPDNVKEIEEGAFHDCERLERIEIGSGLVYIDRRIFDYCLSLKTVIIPASVTAIDQDAFDNCDISDVYYAGTAAQWDKIRGGGADSLMYRAWRIHFESTGPENAVPLTVSLSNAQFEENRIFYDIQSGGDGIQNVIVITAYYEETGKFIGTFTDWLHLPEENGSYNIQHGAVDTTKAKTAKIFTLNNDFKPISPSLNGNVEHW